MSKREECRKCGAKLKHDKTSDQYDPEYCSGKCRREDGVEPYVKTAAEKAAVIVAVKKKKVASLEGYKKGVPANYARRFEPEKLNWSANKMNEEELKQAGFRDNREPIPGDWDYEEPTFRNHEGDTIIDGHVEKEPTEWEQMKAKAKGLNITIFGKNKEQLAAEIKEAENA
jgi:hypothetical protein